MCAAGFHSTHAHVIVVSLLTAASWNQLQPPSVFATVSISHLEPHPTCKRFAGSLPSASRNDSVPCAAALSNAKGRDRSTNQTVAAPAIESPAALLRESFCIRVPVVEMQIVETMELVFFPCYR